MYSSLKKACLTIGLFVTPLAFAGTAYPQSGHSIMKGYVAFEGVAYVDKQPRAKVELRRNTANNRSGLTKETDEHGLYEFDPSPLGEFVLRISAPGFTTYEINVYIPSDFIGNLAVMMKKAGAKRAESQKSPDSRLCVNRRQRTPLVQFGPRGRQNGAG